MSQYTSQATKLPLMTCPRSDIPFFLFPEIKQYWGYVLYFFPPSSSHFKGIFWFHYCYVSKLSISLALPSSTLAGAALALWKVLCYATLYSSSSRNSSGYLHPSSFTSLSLLWIEFCPLKRYWNPMNVTSFKPDHPKDCIFKQGHIHRISVSFEGTEFNS